MSSDDQSWVAWHGLSGKETWPLPKLVAKSDKANRADQNNMIKANEYMDSSEVLEQKIQMVVDMIKKSKHCITYTGAGLSRASGIPDYASKSEESVVKAPKLRSNLDALPTYAHVVLTELGKAGYLKHWVQQNHDGLPQKAGYPQENINEIHGAWFDPSNPVVQFSESLRGDLFDWMVEWEKKADLCLCLGTSLSGMNADRMAKSPAKRFMKQGKGFGTVIINLQQTPMDDMCTIRIWAKLDDAFKLLADKLKLVIKPTLFTLESGNDVFHVPYDAEGKFDPNSDMVLDLRPGAKVKIIVPEAKNFGCLGEVAKPNNKEGGHYKLYLNEKTFFYTRLFGSWWVDSALKGTIAQLPFVNEKPTITKRSEPFKASKSTPSSNSNSNGNADSLTSSFTSLEVEEKKETPKVEKLKIVQSHRLVSETETSNVHNWGLQLEPESEKFVSDVTYKLHPTFRDPEVKVTKAPFRLERIGWGTFTVKVIVNMKDGKKVEAEHELTFKGSGDNVKVTEVKVK